MLGRFVGRLPLLTLTQFVVVLIVLVGLYVALDLNRRARAGRLVGAGEEELVVELELETTRQAELQATLDYVQSEDYVAAYARNEGGFLLPGERRVVPLIADTTPAPTPPPPATPDPGLEARPWQAWWQLLTDAPLPSR